MRSLNVPTKAGEAAVANVTDNEKARHEPGCFHQEHDLKNQAMLPGTTTSLALGARLASFGN
ncbi:hypothetical protein [Zoogloea sp.]|uniref:hypothetical protein n=1 Tax=Zoogloea sp. TaxID=49181 RepID=UPI0026200425|nr:hypothetical protein [Zoogloea sp.]